jgi:hypothetical protein
MLSADSIRWTLEPLPVPDFAAFDDQALIVELFLEADSYRQALRQALQGWHQERRDHERLRVQHHRLLEQFRHLARQRTDRSAKSA